jgi:hypothetical protein
MLVNDLLAQQYWPNQAPIGRRVTLVTGRTRGEIGVVKAIRLRWSLDDLAVQ